MSTNNQVPQECVSSERRVMFDKPTSGISESKVIDVPDGGYGWVVVGAFFLLNISTWASNSAFAIYLAYYLKHDKCSGGGMID